MLLRADATLEYLNRRTGDNLPGWFGMKVTAVSEGVLTMQLEIQPLMLAPNGYLHAATLIALADTSAGYATIAHLPAGATNFTTIELKANFLSTVTEGTLRSEARSVHLGKNTHVWDSIVSHVQSDKRLALFRCTQMILWPKRKGVT
jgi:1,4-dihydroxy-2-naphthoyl-CoA hydrolase